MTGALRDSTTGRDGSGIAPCPSCGLVAEAPEASGLPGVLPFPASRGCYAAWLELAAYDAERARPDFLHQEAVDAYAAQHPGSPARPITLWFALVGLHLALEEGRSGRQVQLAHTRLGRRRTAWEPLDPPGDLGGSTVADVLAHAPGDDRDEAVLEWARHVWELWAPRHAEVAELCRDLGP